MIKLKFCRAIQISSSFDVPSHLLYSYSFGHQSLHSPAAAASPLLNFWPSYADDEARARRDLNVRRVCILMDGSVVRYEAVETTLSQSTD